MVPETVAEPHLTCMNNATPLFSWTLREAFATEYHQSPASAQSSGLMTETVTLKYTSAALDAGGGGGAAAA